MIDEPKYYQALRSNSDSCAFILSYADRFYADVPYHVRKKGTVDRNRDAAKAPN